MDTKHLGSAVFSSINVVFVNYFEPIIKYVVVRGLRINLQSYYCCNHKELNILILRIEFCCHFANHSSVLPCCGRSQSVLLSYLPGKVQVCAEEK